MSLGDLGKQLLEVAKLGLTDEVRRLMSSGAPFTADWLGNSALHFAAQSGHFDTAEALMRAGISRDARTKVDRTPLHLAAQEGHTTIVDLLIVNGADVNASDMLGMTPLHWAVEKGHVDIIQLLISHGAIVDMPNKFEKTPMDIAVRNGRSDLLVELLRQSGQKLVVREAGNTVESATTADGIETAELLTNNIYSQDSEDVHQIHPSEADSEPQSEDLATLAALAEATAENHTNMNASDTLTWLETHGVVSTDDTSIVTSMLESRQMVVLTEAGKLVMRTERSRVSADRDTDDESTQQLTDMSAVTSVQNQSSASTAVDTDELVVTEIDICPPVKKMKVNNSQQSAMTAVHSVSETERRSKNCGQLNLFTNSVKVAGPS